MLVPPLLRSIAADAHLAPAPSAIFCVIEKQPSAARTGTLLELSEIDQTSSTPRIFLPITHRETHNRRASIQGLTTLVPKIALFEDEGQTRELPAERGRTHAGCRAQRGQSPDL